MDIYEPEPIVFYCGLSADIPRIEVTVDYPDGPSETRFDLPTLEQAINEHAENPVESCNESYVNVVHNRMHDPLVTLNSSSAVGS